MMLLQFSLMWAIVLSDLDVVEAREPLDPRWLAGLDPILRLQLQQAVLSDCPSKLVPKLKADCSHPDVLECTDAEGKIIENPTTCEAKCKIQKHLCPEMPECQVNLDYCRRASCNPIRVKTCPETGSHGGTKIEVRRVCTPTLSLACSQKYGKMCAGKPLQECLLKASDAGNCKNQVSNHCVNIPVLTGKNGRGNGKCTTRIGRNCSFEKEEVCRKNLSKKCQDVCQEKISKMEENCVKRCRRPDMRCRKKPSASCYHMVKQKVCE